ncbi:MAG: hypothetical protein ABIP63_10215, partial [Thermoanaerobaculia bacterium]
MKRALFLLLLLAAPLRAEPGKLVIGLTPLGDSPSGVVCRLSWTFTIPSDVPSGVPLVIQGSISQAGTVLKRYRYSVDLEHPGGMTSIQTFPPGEIEIEARLVIPLEENAPVIEAKASAKFPIALTGKTYLANESEGSEAILAEGVAAESSGSVKILPPPRDVAP